MASSDEGSPGPGAMRLPAAPSTLLPYATYTRDQAIAVCGPARSAELLCDDELVVLPGRLLCFATVGQSVEASHFSSAEEFTWVIRSRLNLANDRFTWLPMCLRDGSSRARSGVDLFVRRDSGAAFTYVGRMHLTNWDWTAGERGKWATFQLATPLEESWRPERSLLAESTRIALSEMSKVKWENERVPYLVERLATGNADAMADFYDDLCHQGTVYPDTARAIPFLIKLLEDPAFGSKTQVLWFLVECMQSENEFDAPVSPVGAAIRDGLEVFAALLESVDAEIRWAAGILFATCGRAVSKYAERLRRRVAEERDSHAQTALLMAIALTTQDGKEPILFALFEQSRDPLAKLACATAIIHMQDGKVAEPIAEHVRSHWLEPGEELWSRFDPTGALPWNPESALAKLDDSSE